VVDDAIVVVEAVEHHIEEGMSPRDASFKAMEEVSSPVIMAIAWSCPGRVDTCVKPLRGAPSTAPRSRRGSACRWPSAGGYCRYNCVG
jgi:hypothetical protein